MARGGGKTGPRRVEELDRGYEAGSDVISLHSRMVCGPVPSRGTRVAEGYRLRFSSFFRITFWTMITNCVIR